MEKAIIPCTYALRKWSCHNSVLIGGYNSYLVCIVYLHTQQYLVADLHGYILKSFSVCNALVHLHQKSHQFLIVLRDQTLLY